MVSAAAVVLAPGAEAHGFVESLVAIGETTISGCLVAAFVAALAYFVTGRFARRREEARARHERSLAAAEEFYAAYGEFFATWKAWEFARGRDEGELKAVAEDVQRKLLDKAADCEGHVESLVIRLAQEQTLSRDDRLALWAMRFGIKSLRRAIREGKPLGWWRTDDPDRPSRSPGYATYLSFKTLSMRVASIMIDSDAIDAQPPKPRERDRATEEVTATMSPAHPRVPRPLTDKEWALAVRALAR